MTQILALFNQPAAQAIIMLIALVVDIVRSLFSRETKQDVRVVSHHLSYDQGKEVAPASFFRTLLHALLIAILAWMAITAYLAQVTDPTAPAKAAVQSLYDDINAKDYQNAYGLTSNGLGHTYAQFTQGFADTKHHESAQEKGSISELVQIGIRQQVQRPHVREQFCDAMEPLTKRSIVLARLCPFFSCCIE